MNIFEWHRALRDDDRLDGCVLGTALVISTYINSNGEAWPKRKLVAEGVSKSSSTVDRHIKLLIDLNYLTAEDRRPKTTLYRMALPGQLPTSDDLTTHGCGVQLPTSEELSAHPCVVNSAPVGSSTAHQCGVEVVMGEEFIEGLSELPKERPTELPEEVAGQPPEKKPSVISGPAREDNPYPNVSHSKTESLDQVILETFSLHGLKCPISTAMAMGPQLTSKGLSTEKAIEYVREKMLEIGGEYPARTARRILVEDAKDWAEDKKNGGSKPAKAKRYGVFEDTEEIREFARRGCEKTTKNPELMFEGARMGDFDDVDWSGIDEI